MRTKTLTMAAAAVAALSLAACGQGESGGAPDQQNQAANTVQDTTAGAVGAVAAPVA
ncbi:MAG: carbohydrate ABC transporter substrate-binding protein, partial [Brevundimonas sp.]